MEAFLNKANLRTFTVFVILGLLVISTSADERIPKCSFTQSCIRDASQKGMPCPDPTNTETPVAQVGFPKVPDVSMKYLQNACPYLADGRELCCNDDQILNMYNNFKTIDSLFGNCLICSINLKRFWCEYTCSPYQFYMLDSFDQIHVEEVDYPVLNQTMRIDNNIACDIYNSCNKNPFVTSLASGQSAPGFLEFMGSNAVQTGKVKISFEFDSNPEQSLVMDMYACDMEVGDTLEEYVVAPCTCNYCEPACKPNDIKAYPAFFDGFNWLVVGLVYLGLIILSVIIYFLKKRWQTGDDEEISLAGDDDDHGKNLLGLYDSSISEGKEKLINESTGNQDSDTFGKINGSSMNVSSDVHNSR